TPAQDRPRRHLHSIRGRRIFLPAQHSRPQLPGETMSTPATRNVLRPGPGGFKAKIMAWVMERVPFVFRLLRAFKPIVRFGNTIVVTRYDDVREVFLNVKDFRVPYHDKLMVITGNQPFFLSMDDPAAHNGDTEALRKVV